MVAEFGVAEYFAMGEALAVIATFLVTLYFSRKEIKSLRVDIESKVLNDLNEQIHGMGDVLVEHPELVKMLNRNVSKPTPDIAFAYYILYMCAHAYRMRQRKILSDNEWEGWLRWMKAAFEQGEISDYWKNRIEPQRWFDPSFQEFIDTRVLPSSAAAAAASANAPK